MTTSAWCWFKFASKENGVDFRYRNSLTQKKEIVNFSGNLELVERGEASANKPVISVEGIAVPILEKD
ncbi:hypothetical protein C6495_00125 [Candidatus Poribacteria bacterium]|nr:MAG: hypothetical protein C6495_00125 [Candidatus Poribacteria bacterium]